MLVILPYRDSDDSFAVKVESIILATPADCGGSIVVIDYVSETKAKYISLTVEQVAEKVNKLSLIEKVNKPNFKKRRGLSADTALTKF